MKHLIKLWKSLTFGLALGLTSCATYGNEHRMLAAIEVLQEEELAEQVSMALTAEQRERLVEDLVDLPEGLAETLRAAEEETLSLAVGDWHDIVIAIRKDQVRNPERYDGKGPLAEILLKLVVELEEAGYPHNRHPTAVRWQKEHLVIAENLSSLPSRARVRIVDQDGEPMEGVTLEIDKSILRPLAWEPTSRMRTVTVDGERTIRIGGAFVDDINLTARKDGYYTARRPVRQPRRENVEGLTERAWKDVVLGRETVIDPEEPKLLNVVLELRKKGEIVK
ncbi:MAG: carboxypeptidase regulatory-like domain-containing protein, partial [Opitutales bacterium]|nr:carboxypeptidase regulatory-like domain-containing protein [Opitutales bacterium]